MVVNVKEKRHVLSAQIDVGVFIGFEEWKLDSKPFEAEGTSFPFGSHNDRTHAL